MQLGLIGLGKMGGNMAERLRLGGHQVVGFDFNAEAVAKLTEAGNVGVSSLEDLAKNLKGRRAIWIMVPQGKPVDDTIAKLEPLLNPGDILIDGGNSKYKDSMRHYKEVTAKGFQFVDVGTSGGVWGLKEGYSMMIGGDKDPVDYLRPIFETLAPAADKGWGHVGPAGAGHFVKMVHNGIEYGMMQAYAEGFTVMEKKEEFHLDLPQIAQIWRYGSVVRSWLLDLTADALAGNPTLDGLAGVCRGFRRGPLDGVRGDRSECVRAGDHRVGDPPHPLARGEQLYRPHAGHHAQRVWRACGEEELGIGQGTRGQDWDQGQKLPQLFGECESNLQRG